jgi:hypothetical protein
MRSIAAAVLAAFFMAGSAAPAFAQSSALCGRYDTIKRELETAFSEHLAGQGLTSNGFAFELWVSNARTWTTVLRIPTGSACVIAAGNIWEFFNERRKDEKDVY